MEPLSWIQFTFLSYMMDGVQCVMWPAVGHCISCSYISGIGLAIENLTTAALLTDETFDQQADIVEVKYVVVMFIVAGRFIQ